MTVASWGALVDHLTLAMGNKLRQVKLFRGELNPDPLSKLGVDLDISLLKPKDTLWFLCG